MENSDLIKYEVINRRVVEGIKKKLDYMGKVSNEDILDFAYKRRDLLNKAYKIMGLDKEERKIYYRNLVKNLRISLEDNLEIEKKKSLLGLGNLGKKNHCRYR